MGSGCVRSLEIAYSHRGQPRQSPHVIGDVGRRYGDLIRALARGVTEPMG
jgi:hypothetical protein